MAKPKSTTTPATATPKRRRTRGPAVPAALVTPLAVLHGIQALQATVPTDYTGVHGALDQAIAEIGAVVFDSVVPAEVASRIQARQAQQSVEQWGKTFEAAGQNEPIVPTDLPSPQGGQLAEEVTLRDGSNWQIRREASSGVATGYRRAGTRVWSADIEGFQAVEANAVSGTDGDGFTADGG